MSALEWKDVCLRLQTSGRPPRLVIQNITGKLNDGDFLAILGPSGSGKTSLLNALSGRVRNTPGALLTGEVLLSGQPVTTMSAARKISYIMQEDFLFAHLTVYETLLLSAKFHLPHITSESEIQSKVEHVMQELGLLPHKNAIIGSPSQRGISGGEKKRVAIGKELMASPSFLFLDEPTSGLDAFQACSVTEILRTLTSTGRVVIAILHQPRSAIFDLFDKLFLISEGKTMYFGDASRAVPYFTRIGFPCPEHYNPADYFLDIISVDNRSTLAREQSLNRVESIAALWATAAYPFSLLLEDGITGEEEMKTVQLVTSPVRGDGGGGGGPTTAMSISCYYSWCTNFQLLAWRAFTENTRNYGALLIRLITITLTTVLLSLVYQNLPYNQRSINDRRGLLFFIVINQGFGPLISISSVFPSEKRIVFIERLSSSYQVSAYFLGRVLAELPSQIVFVILFCTVIYWSSGLNPQAAQFFIFLGIVFLDTICTLSLGLFISAIAPSTAIANAIGPPVLLIFIIFGGFYINSQSLPYGSTWVKNISPLYWAFQGLALNEFQGAKFTCDNTYGICQSTGEQVLVSLGFATTKITTCVLGLSCLTIGFLLLAYFSLLFNVERFLKIQTVRGDIGNELTSRNQINGGEEGEMSEEAAEAARRSKHKKDEATGITMYY